MKKAIPTLNVRLLNRVKRQILKEPKQFQMDSYFDTAGHYSDTADKIPNCGTAACIAGWALALDKGITPEQAKGKVLNYRTLTGERADRILGARGAGWKLFNDCAWPESFRDEWRRLTKLKQWKRRAKVAAARIDHFIKTGE